MLPGLNKASGLFGKQSSRFSAKDLLTCADPTVVFNPPNGDPMLSGLGSPCKSGCHDGMECCFNGDGKKVCAGKYYVCKDRG